jgi:hypothetical protein
VVFSLFSLLQHLTSAFRKQFSLDANDAWFICV